MNGTSSLLIVAVIAIVAVVFMRGAMRDHSRASAPQPIYVPYPVPQPPPAPCPIRIEPWIIIPIGPGPHHPHRALA